MLCHRYHQISESTHLILNPLSIEKLALVEDICSPTPSQAVLDLGCIGTLDMMRAVPADAQAQNV